MKKISKILSLVLALALVLALGTAAFAANSVDDANKGTITVDNPVNGQTYTAYKIFDVSYDTTVGAEAYAYTIKTNSEWFETVKKYADAAGSGLTLTKANGVDDTYVVEIGEGFSAAKFAATLKTAVDGKTGTKLTLAEDQKTATASNLDLGYYFVTSSTGALCNLTTTNPTTTIHDKNNVPFDKADDKESVEVGETVTYTITGKVPDYTGFTAYTYLITDEMSTGLTFDGVGTVKVTVGGTDVTGACKINLDGSNSNKFTVSIPVMSYTIGDEIKVTYTAKVNENAVAKVEKNHAVLEYSNDPTDAESKDKITDEETVYSAKIVIDKYAARADANDKTHKLAGAQFVLYKEVNGGKQYYKWNDETKVVEWVADKKEATVKTTDKTGATSFDGLKDGTYYLEETAAPTGYNLLKDAVKVVIDGNKEDVASLTVKAEVANSTGAELPETGGIGTTIFYLVGGLMVAIAGILLVTKKRLSKNEG